MPIFKYLAEGLGWDGSKKFCLENNIIEIKEVFKKLQYKFQKNFSSATGLSRTLKNRLLKNIKLTF